MGLIWTNVLHGGYPQESGRYYVKILSSPLFKVGNEIYKPDFFTTVEQYFTDSDGPAGAGFYMHLTIDDEHYYWDKWEEGLIVYWAKIDDDIKLANEDAKILYKKFFSHKI